MLYFFILLILLQNSFPIIVPTTMVSCGLLSSCACNFIKPLPMHPELVPCFDVWLACTLILADRPASLDFNQACYTKFVADLPFCSCKNTICALSLSSIKFFCISQAVLGLLFTVAATIVHHISNYASPL